MVKKGDAKGGGNSHISAERGGRLFKLVKVLAGGTASRGLLLKKLRVGMRTFYRDLDLLRECGVAIRSTPGGYELDGDLDGALDCIPFPDPELTFGEVIVLMKGRSKGHKRLKRIFDELAR